MVPLLLAFILGPLLEKSLLQSLVLFQGNVSGFLGRPMAMVLIAVGILLIVIAILKATGFARQDSGLLGAVARSRVSTSQAARLSVGQLERRGRAVISANVTLD